MRAAGPANQLKYQASGGTSGGQWEVKDGVITGTQNPPKNGGLLLTDELLGEFEVVLE